ncbi:MAG: T9SS type B sorting domain-containing protein [Flammeovirgaceae bacterium]
MRRHLPLLLFCFLAHISFAQDCEISITASDNVITCDNTVTLTVPLNDGFDYRWFKDKRVISGATDTIYIVTEPGLYEVVMSNFNDPGAVPCSTTDGITITQSLNDYPISIGNDTSICANESVTLRSNRPATSYTWSTGETTREITFSPTHDVGVEPVWLIVSNNGCQGADTVEINIKPTPEVSFPIDTTVCGSDTLTLDATNANATYLWSDNSTASTLKVTVAGQYWVTADNGACSDSDTVTVAFVAPPTIDLGADLSLCIGDQVTLNAGNPGFNPTWSTGATTQEITFVATTAGESDLWVSLENGTCEDRDSIKITVLETPVADLGNDLTACEGVTFTLIPPSNTGVTYLWSDGSTADTLTIDQTGQYWVNIDNGTCSDADTLEATFVVRPDAQLGNDITLCMGDTITLGDPTTTFTPTWSTGATSSTIDFIATTAGTFDIWLKLENPYCDDFDTLTITVRDLPVVNLGDDINGCDGENFLLDAQNAGAGYTWSDNSGEQTLAVSTTGQYWVEVDDNFCINRDTIDVTIHPQPVVDLGADVSLCDNQTFELDAGNTFSTFEYTWSTGSKDQKITVDKDMTAPISVIVSNAYCSANDEIDFTFFSLPTVDLGADQEVCTGTAITLDAGSFTAYRWTKTSGTMSTIGTDQTLTFTATTPDTYMVTVTDANGCENSGSVSINRIFELPTVNLGLDLGICENASTTFDAGAGFSRYTWQDGSSNQTFEANAIGTYSVEVEDANGCKNSDEVQITQIFALPKPSIPDAELDCDTEQATLSAGSFDEYLWDDGSIDADRIVTQEGTYTVTVKDGNGCEQSTSVTVTDPCDFQILFPNAFLATSTAINPRFTPVYSRIVAYNFFIFDRWGKVIFQTQDIDQGWDGTIGGKQAPVGNYLYKAIYTGKRKGELVTEETQGSLMLMR